MSRYVRLVACASPTLSSRAAALSSLLWLTRKCRIWCQSRRWYVGHTAKFQIIMMSLPAPQLAIGPVTWSWNVFGPKNRLLVICNQNYSTVPCDRIFTGGPVLTNWHLSKPVVWCSFVNNLIHEPDRSLWSSRWFLLWCNDFSSCYIFNAFVVRTHLIMRLAWALTSILLSCATLMTLYQDDATLV